MSERRYTVTEILDDVKETSRMVQVSINGRTAMYWDDWVAHLDDAFSDDLTPDPEPSGEVVGNLYAIDGMSVEMVAEAFGILTAEVTRQVEERTKGYREALERIASQRAGGECGGSRDPNNYNYLRNEAVQIARQALANKGGSDE